MHTLPEEQRAHDRTERRFKKGKPKMRVSGKGMKRKLAKKQEKH